MQTRSIFFLNFISIQSIANWGSVASSGDITTVQKVPKQIFYKKCDELTPNCLPRIITWTRFGCSPSSSAMIDTAGKFRWQDSVAIWWPSVLSGVIIKVSPCSHIMGSQNITVFPEPVAEIDTILDLERRWRVTLACHTQGQIPSLSIPCSCSSRIASSEGASGSLTMRGLGTGVEFGCIHTVCQRCTF